MKDGAKRSARSEHRQGEEDVMKTELENVASYCPTSMTVFSDKRIFVL